MSSLTKRLLLMDRQHNFRMKHGFRMKYVVEMTLIKRWVESTQLKSAFVRDSISKCESLREPSCGHLLSSSFVLDVTWCLRLLCTPLALDLTRNSSQGSLGSSSSENEDIVSQSRHPKSSSPYWNLFHRETSTL